MTTTWSNEGSLISTKSITIRNIWLLMLYASENFAHFEHTRTRGSKETLIENEHIPDIVAEILLYFTQERLLRGLTHSCLTREADVTRVRGSINILRTATRKLLVQGKVACRFYAHTLNTPRNCLIKAALEKGANLARSPIAEACRTYANILNHMGVTGNLPDRYTLSKSTDSINTREERFVLSAARLMLDMALPQTLPGQNYLPLPQYTEEKLRKLFEKAIRGFYRVTVSDTWHVAPGNVTPKWAHSDVSPGLDSCLPRMELDVILRRRSDNYKVIIDTKFTPLLKQGYYRNESLSSTYIYQMYAYLRTQEGSPDSQHATGILLHPSLGETQIHSCIIQGHTFIFATINLNAHASDIRKDLLNILCKATATLPAN